MARLFEKWLDAGDDRTFSEWLAYRRALATQRRAQGDAHAQFYDCNWQQQRLGFRMQSTAIGLPNFQQVLGGALGGLLG